MNRLFTWREGWFYFAGICMDNIIHIDSMICAQLCLCLVLFGLNQPLMCWIYFRKSKSILAFYIISQYRNDAGSWNPSLQKTGVRCSCMVNTMVADDLAKQGPRTILVVLTAVYLCQYVTPRSFLSFKFQSDMIILTLNHEAPRLREIFR